MGVGYHLYKCGLIFPKTTELSNVLLFSNQTEYMETVLM